jgi:hypothetical protein
MKNKRILIAAMCLVLIMLVGCDPQVVSEDVASEGTEVDSPPAIQREDVTPRPSYVPAVLPPSEFTHSVEEYTRVMVELNTLGPASPRKEAFREARDMARELCERRDMERLRIAASMWGEGLAIVAGD